MRYSVSISNPFFFWALFRAFSASLSSSADRPARIRAISPASSCARTASAASTTSASRSFRYFSSSSFRSFATSTVRSFSSFFNASSIRRSKASRSESTDRELRNSSLVSRSFRPSRACGFFAASPASGSSKLSIEDFVESPPAAVYAA